MVLATAVLGALALAGLAACGDDGDDDGGAQPNPVIEGAPELTVTGNNLQFDPEELSTPAGDFNVALRSEDTFHDFVIEDVDGIVEASGDETGRGSFTIGDPGEYTFYCSVPGHREGGMEGTLTVE